MTAPDFTEYIIYLAASRQKLNELTTALLFLNDSVFLVHFFSVMSQEDATYLFFLLAKPQRNEYRNGNTKENVRGKHIHANTANN